MLPWYKFEHYCLYYELVQKIFLQNAGKFSAHSVKCCTSSGKFPALTIKIWSFLLSACRKHISYRPGTEVLLIQTCPSHISTSAADSHPASNTLGHWYDPIFSVSTSSRLFTSGAYEPLLFIVLIIFCPLLAF